MKGSSPWSRERAAKIAELYAAGEKIDYIAFVFRCDRSLPRKIAAQQGIAPRRPRKSHRPREKP